MGFGTSGAPEAGAPEQSERLDAPDVAGAAQAAGQLEKEELAVEIEDTGMIAYVASATHANSRWLVRPGKVVATAVPAGVTTGIIPLVKRDGDIWAKFVNGVMVTEDPIVIKWCGENTDICRRSDDPMTKGWATLKNLQARKANREQLVDPSEMNADEAFHPGNLQEHIAAQAAKSGSAGDTLVKNAELTKKSIEDTAARK